MTVYFLSCTPAALKLNGVYLGTIDGFERHVQLDPSPSILAEIVPLNNLQPLNFALDESFFKAPPPFADVYLMDGDALVYVTKYAVKDASLNVLFQTRFAGNLITVFSQGGIFLSIEGAEYSLTPLPDCFNSVRTEIKEIAGRNVLLLHGGKRVVILSEIGKIIFQNTVDNIECGEKLNATIPFETCTAAKAQCVFDYDGESLTLISSQTVETVPPEKSVIHFAFFESVLTCGNFEKYLDESLKAKAKDLKSYLGEFVSVTVPPEKFYLNHGKIAAAGLCYPEGKNLYKVKYFAVDYNGEFISNIYPIE